MSIPLPPPEPDDVAELEEVLEVVELGIVEEGSVVDMVRLAAMKLSGSNGVDCRLPN